MALRQTAAATLAPVKDLATIARALSGRFIAFEGADGSGKSTQLRRFVDALTGAGATVCEVREPGGTPIGEEVRKILLHTKEEMTLHCEMLLYMASRAQLVEQRILPALAAGHVVIADRFLSSTVAYQGAAGGIPEAEILAVGKVATRGRLPDLVLIFDVDLETATKRTRGVEPAKGKGGAGGGGGGAPRRLRVVGAGTRLHGRELEPSAAGSRSACRLSGGAGSRRRHERRAMP